MAFSDIFNSLITCLGFTVFIICVLCSCSSLLSNPESKQMSSITVIAIPENTNLDNSNNLKLSSSMNANLQTVDENKVDIKFSTPEAFNSIKF